VPKLGLIDRIPGFLANPKAGLVLKFQLNPIELEDTKEVQYEVENVPGWDGPIITWVSSGARHIRFDLMFDRTEEGSSIGLYTKSFYYDIVGVMDLKAILEGFLYPSFDKMFKLSDTKTMKPPPDCYFVYGVRWARTKMISCPIKEIVHDKFLIPRRITTSVDLLVMEQGMLHQINTATRKGLAIAGSVANTLEFGKMLAQMGAANLTGVSM